MTVNILGTPYGIIVKKYDEDECFEKEGIDGYCYSQIHQIIVCDMHTYKGWEHEPEEVIEWEQKKILRHEIVHAFFHESGLWDNSVDHGGAWAKNEEMVDWIAIQGEKIYKAWQEANAL